MSFQARISSGIDARLRGAAAGAAGTVEQAFNSLRFTDFTNGTGAGQANRYHASNRTLAASTTLNIDLAGGLVDAFGNTITFTAIKALRVVAAATNTGTFAVFRPASNGWPGFFEAASDSIIMPPGASFLIERRDAAGWTVTAGTGDLLGFSNGIGNPVNFTLEIIGIGA